MRDELTGLLTRKSLFEILKENIDTYIVMMDVDRFKVINDTFGHRVGDEVLCKVANILKSFENRNVFAIRYAGDEFVLLVRENREILEKILEELTIKLKHLTFNYDGEPFSVSMSLGVYLHKEGEDPEISIRKADRSLLFSKSTGRDRILFYEEIGEDYIKDEFPFVGREFAFKSVLKWYRNPTKYFLFIEGNKGSGKSRFLSELRNFLSPYKPIFVEYSLLKRNKSEEFVASYEILKQIANYYSDDNEEINAIKSKLSGINLPDYNIIMDIGIKLFDAIDNNVVFLIDNFTYMNDIDVELLFQWILRNKKKIKMICTVDSKELRSLAYYDIIKDIYTSINSETIFLGNISSDDIFRSLTKYYGKYLPFYFVEELRDLSGGNPLILKEISSVFSKDENFEGIFEYPLPSNLDRVSMYFIGIPDEKLIDILISASFVDNGIPLKLIESLLGEEDLKLIDSLYAENVIGRNNKGNLVVNYKIIRNLFFSLPIYRQKRVIDIIEEVGGSTILYILYFASYMEDLGKKEILRILRSNKVSSKELVRMYAFYKKYSDTVFNDPELLSLLIEKLMLRGLYIFIENIIKDKEDIIDDKGFIDVICKYYIRTRNVNKLESIMNKLKKMEESEDKTLYREYYLGILKGEDKWNEYIKKMEEYKNTESYVNMVLAHFNHILRTTDEIEDDFEEKVISLLSYNTVKRNDLLKAHIFAFLGTYYYRKKDLENAKEMYEKSLAIYKKIGDIDRMASLYMNLGIIYQDIGHWRTALKHYKNALRFFKNRGGDIKTARSLNNIATLYIQLGSIDNALDYLEDAFIISSNLGNDRLIGIVLYNKAVAYLVSHEYSLSLQSIEEASEVFSMGGYNNFLFMCTCLKAEIFLWMGEKEIAREIVEPYIADDNSVMFLFYLSTLEKRKQGNIMKMIDMLAEDMFTKARYYLLAGLYMRRIDKNVAMSLLMESEGIFNYLGSYRYISEIRNLYKEMENDE